MSSSEAGLVGRPPNREEKHTAPMGYGMDAMFAPSSVAVIGATASRHRRPLRSGEPAVR